MTTSTEFGVCVFLALHAEVGNAVPQGSFQRPEAQENGSPSHYLPLFGLSTATNGEAEMQQTAGSFLA